MGVPSLKNLPDQIMAPCMVSTSELQDYICCMSSEKLSEQISEKRRPPVVKGGLQLQFSVKERSQLLNPFHISKFDGNNVCTREVVSDGEHRININPEIVISTHDTVIAYSSVP